MELVAYGAQDVYLTGNPQITFFKVVYRRHTNFSIETIEQSASGNSLISSSENEASFTIARNGDLIHKVYLTTDKLTNNGIEFGSKSIKEIEISIGGQMIDRYTQEWQDIWNELTTPKCKALGLKSMIGDIGFSNCNSITDTDKMDDKGVNFIQIPLLFWFCRNPGLALPLIALQYHEVKIDIKFNKLSDIVDETSNTEDITYSLYVDYIYLDTDERRRFAQVSHEYLIEQLQIVKTSNSTIQELNINHPVKELIWTSSRHDGANYGAAKLILNGHDRFSKQKEEYFQLRQPYDYHTSIPHPNLPRAAIHNVTFRSKKNILNSELTSIQMTDSAGTATTLASKLDNVLGCFNTGLTALNNDFDFNATVGNATSNFIYLPTYYLRADHSTHPHLFDVDNLIYPSPGHFVNESILRQPDFDTLKHTFIPRDIRFLNFTSHHSTFPRLPGHIGKLNYKSEDSSNLLTNVDDLDRGQRVVNEFGLTSSARLQLIDDNGDNYDSQQEPRLWENSEDFMVLILNNTIADNLIEGDIYEFEVESTNADYSTVSRPLGQVKHIMATVRKIIRGTNVASVADNNDARTAAFSAKPNGVGVNTGTDQNKNIFAFESETASTILEAQTQATSESSSGFGANFSTLSGDQEKAIPARGIVLAGTQADKINQVSFIYLDQNISPFFDSDDNIFTEAEGVFRPVQHGWDEIGFLNTEEIVRFLQSSHTDQDTSRIEIPSFKIKKIMHSNEIHSKKGTSTTSHLRKKINVYSFALKPEEHQPSGTCNFSRIDTAQLITDTTIGDSHNIYAVNYNVLRIMSGMGGLAYSN